MSNQNNYSRNGGRHYTDPTSARYNTKYHQRGGPKYYRPEHNRRPINGDDVNTLMMAINRHLTTDGNPSQEFSLRGRTNVRGRDRRPQRPPKIEQVNQTGWWRISIQQAGTIGKERVMSTLQAHCLRQFQPYHYFIDPQTKAGVFFVNSHQDADMIKRANGKVEVQNLDILRIVVGRVSTPIPSLDADLRPHFKDFLFNRRFNQQTFQLDLSNLADDEGLSTLGIFPQLNKQAFIRDVVNIINKDFPMIRQLDLGSNNIMNLYEFRHLHLDNLLILSFASNQLKNIEDFDHLKQLSNLTHIYITNNPLTKSNIKQNNSIDDIISCILQQPSINWSISYHSSTIQKKLPQLQRINDIELKRPIGLGIDNEITTLPKSVPHCVPQSMQTFFARFIEEFYRLFDTRDRGELHTCYHDLCMFSLCITALEDSPVRTRPYTFGSLIYDSRNLQKINDINRRINLLLHGKMAVLDFLKIKFPLTKHDGNSFHVDVISTDNNRAVFTVNGLFREVNQNADGPVRCFQRTFTCAQTANSVLIIADHIMLTNATDAQVFNMTHPSTTQTMTNQNSSNITVDVQNQMIQKFSEQSGMTIEYSNLCLQENNWNYDKAAEVFLDLQNKNMIPVEAFKKS